MACTHPSLKIDQCTIASDNLKTKFSTLSTLNETQLSSIILTRLSPQNKMSGVDELFLKTVSYDMFTKLPQIIFNSSLVTIDGKDFFFKRLISTRHCFTHHYFYVIVSWMKQICVLRSFDSFLFCNN